ncbi:MAG: RND transporter, partial [Desulfobaccales bacterium]
MGPDYKRPETKVPETWDGQKAVTTEQSSKTTTAPVQLVEWWEAFKDPTLSSLVEMAVRAN